MKAAISLACSMQAPLEQDLKDYQAARCGAVELYFGKLEQYLATHSLDAMRHLLAASELEMPVAAFQGGLLDSEGEARREAWQLFERRLELCRALGVGTVVVAGDVQRPVDAALVARVQDSLVQVAELAERHEVRAALEFQGRATLANNLCSALALVQAVGSDWLGLCLDVFHYYTGPSKAEDLAGLTRENLLHVQVCDLAGTPRELASPSDAVLPGDGDFQWSVIIERLKEIGYEGYVSLEVLNPRMWGVPPLQLGEIGITAVRRLLGQASME